MRPLSANFADVFPTLIERVGLNYGAAAAAVRVVIHLLLLIQSVVADLMGLNTKNISFLRTAKNRLTQYIAHGIREQCHDIDAIHDLTSPQSDGL